MCFFLYKFVYSKKYAMESAGLIANYLPEYLVTFVDELDEHPWLFASLASLLVGLSGILPLLIIPIDETASFKDGCKYCFVYERYAMTM